MYAEVGDFTVSENKSYVPTSTISRNSCYVPTTIPPNSRGEGRSEGKSIKKLLLMLSLVVLALMLGTICACVAFALEVLNLKSNILKNTFYVEGLRQQPNTSLDLQLQAVIMNKSSELSASIQQLNTSHTPLIQQLNCNGFHLPG